MGLILVSSIQPVQADLPACRPSPGEHAVCFVYSSCEDSLTTERRGFVVTMGRGLNPFLGLDLKGNGHAVPGGLTQVCISFGT